MNKRIYAEVGFGNDSFFSTEFEEGDFEYRVPKFVLPNRVDTVYFRFWIFKKVFIFSTKKGFEIVTKDRNKLKVLF